MLITVKATHRADNLERKHSVVLQSYQDSRRAAAGLHIANHLQRETAGDCPRRLIPVEIVPLAVGK